MNITTYFEQFPVSSFNKGDIILQPDDSPSSVFYINKGFVRVYTLTEWGDEKLYLIYKEKEFFPVYYLFDNNKLDKFYEALSTVSIRRSPITQFLEAVKKDHELHFELTKYLAGSMSVFLNRIETLECTSAYMRVVTRLLFLAQRFGQQKRRHTILDVPITHQDIASSTALSRETVSREFEKLEKKRLVGYRDHTIVIYDMKKLQMELHSE